MPKIKYKTDEERKEAEYNRKKLWAEMNKEKNKISKENYYIKNKEKIKKKNKEYRDNNTDKEKDRHIKYLTENIEKRKETTKTYREKNRDIINKKAREEANKITRNNNHKKRYNDDDLYRLNCNIRSLIRQSFKNKGVKKNTLTKQILGCSFDEFKLHLESKFEPWMNWDNYGLYNGELNFGWDIDHIIPIASAVTEDELLKLNRYTNLQPLCSKINRYIKKNNLIQY